MLMWQEAVAEGLADRLDDCKRTFPVAAVINGAGEPAAQHLRPAA